MHISPIQATLARIIYYVNSDLASATSSRISGRRAALATVCHKNRVLLQLLAYICPKKVPVLMWTCVKIREGHQRFWGQGSNFILVQKRCTKIKVTRARRSVEDQRGTYCLLSPQGSDTTTTKSMLKIPLRLENNLNISEKKYIYIFCTKCLVLKVCLD